MQAYVKYLEQVLGVQKVLVDRKDLLAEGAFADGSSHSAMGSEFEIPAFFYSSQGPVKTGHFFQKVRLAIINEVDALHDSVFQNKQVSELFVKMKAALKLPESQILVLDCVMNDRNLIPAEFLKIVEAQGVLWFSRSPQAPGRVQEIGDAKWVEAYSPSHLIDHPDDKKWVWSQMQLLMKELN